MRIFGIGFLLMLLSPLVNAAEVYNCEAHLPQGIAQIIAKEGIEVGNVLEITFKNESRNQFHVGRLRVVSRSGDSFLAQGFVKTYERNPVKQIFLAGKSRPDSEGRISFQIYANGDRRLDFGFGNVLTCQL